MYYCIILTCNIRKNKCFIQECLFFFTRDRGKAAILFLAVFLGIKMCVFNSHILEVTLIECIPWSHYTKKNDNWDTLIQFFVLFKRIPARIT